MGLPGGKPSPGRFVWPVLAFHGPARVLKAWSVSNAISWRTKRTEPSAKAKLAPPGWSLPKAHSRSLDVAIGGGGGPPPRPDRDDRRRGLRPKGARRGFPTTREGGTEIESEVQ